TACAMMLPSTCAPSLIWRSEARTSPSIRPKTCAGPLHSMLPTIDMSEPMQEAVPALVVGSDLAQVWSCGTTLPVISAALTGPFLSFSGAPLFVLINMSTPVSASYDRTDSSTQHQRYHLLSAATLNNSRNRNFVHRKDHGRIEAGIPGSPRPHRRRRTSRADLCERAPSGVGGAAAEDRPTQSPHAHFGLKKQATKKKKAP